MVASSGLSIPFSDTGSHEQETLLGKAPNPIRPSDEEEPKFTRRRTSHQLKQQSHNSWTPSGMLTSSTPLPRKHETPIHSSDEEEPKVTRRRRQHHLKQRSHNSRTLFGINNVLLANSPPMSSSSKDHCWFWGRRRDTLGSLQIAALSLLLRLTTRHDAAKVLQFSAFRLRSYSGAPPWWKPWQHVSNQGSLELKMAACNNFQCSVEENFAAL